MISRQQLKAAHAQRAEDAEQDKHRRSIERRFSAYADLLDKARFFRNALRPYGYQPVPQLAPKEISALARSAHAASPLAFLVVESRRTRVALGELVKAMSDIQGVLDDDGSDPADKPWPDLNERIKSALDKFEDSYGSCRSLSWRLVGVSVPALVGLLGLVLVAAPPQCPGAAVGLVAPGLGDDGPPELSQQLRNGDRDEAEGGGAAVAGALAGGGHGKGRHRRAG